MKKKYLALALAAVLTATCFGACAAIRESEQTTGEIDETSEDAGDTAENRIEEAGSTEENPKLDAAEEKPETLITEESPETETANEAGEPELSEEDLYWKGIADSMNDRYDLSAALIGPALKDLCADYFTLGVGINGSTLENQTLNLPEYMAVSSKHFNSCTMTNLMKSCYILDQTGSIDSLNHGDGSPVLTFESIDPTLQWCMDNGMQMRGHTLVWHTQAPDWFFRVGYEEGAAYVDRDTMLFRMESYIAQLMTHVQDNYPGVIYCWDVVNEAVDPDMGDKDSFFKCRTQLNGDPNPWYETIGEDYVEMAFTYARKYQAEGVKLFYNDFNTYMIPKMNAIYALAEHLKEKGLIDGIGMQGYWGLDNPSINSIEVAIKKYAQLELEIHITELSIDVSEETEANFEKQGKTYGRVFYLFKSLDTASGGPANITNVTLFGLVDHYREGDTTNTRIFDKDYQPKPAFDKIRAVLEH